MNQTGLLIRVYQIDEHDTQLSGSRQKSFRHRLAAMQLVKIYLEQLMIYNAREKQIIKEAHFLSTMSSIDWINRFTPSVRYADM